MKICAYHVTPPMFRCPFIALGVREKENVEVAEEDGNLANVVSVFFILYSTAVEYT